MMENTKQKYKVIIKRKSSQQNDSMENLRCYYAVGC